MQELAKLPWLVGGDFNEICYDSKKSGGNPKSYHQTQSFRETIEACSLQDLHESGEFLTWVNRRSSENLIFERLDRYIVTFEWRMLYPAARALSLKFFLSEHCPIPLELGAAQLQLHCHSNRFHFETLWPLNQIAMKLWRGDGTG